MNLAKEGRLLYVSMVDVSLPNGPGVNEREFLLSLYEGLGDRVHALLPAPRRPCPEIDDARTTYYRSPRRWNIPGFFLQQFELRRRLREFTRQGRFDLMVARLSMLPLAIDSVRRGPLPLAVKTLGEVRGHTRSRGLKGFVSRCLAPLDERLHRRIVRRSLALDACTDILLDAHRRGFGVAVESSTLVPNATNVTRFAPRPAERTKSALGLSGFQHILGYVGGSPWERGGRQVLDVVASLRSEFPGLGAVIVGEDKGDELHRRAGELGILDRVALPGVIPYERVADYVNCFDIGFALDRPERARHTGNSYQKVRQYLACGKPVVTCLEGDDVLSNQSFLSDVHPDDLNSMLQMVRDRLKMCAEDRDQMSRRAAAFARAELSTDRTLHQRLSFWQQRLTTRAA